MTEHVGPFCPFILKVFCFTSFTLSPPFFSKLQKWNFLLMYNFIATNVYILTTM